MVNIIDRMSDYDDVEYYVNVLGRWDENKYIMLNYA